MRKWVNAALLFVVATAIGCAIGYVIIIAINNYRVGDDYLTSENQAAKVLPCPALTSDQSWHLAKALMLMRKTSDGEQLYEMLIAQKICITSHTLIGAIAEAPTTFRGKKWLSGSIVFDPNFLNGSVSDEFLASILVHEATHQQDALDGRDCEQLNDCVITTNHESYQDESSAYRAQAKWWIDMYGAYNPPHKDYWDNYVTSLAEAYSTGPVTFKSWVISAIGQIILAK